MAIETSFGSALRILLFQKITTKTFHLFHTHAPPLLSLAPAAQQPAWQRCTFPLQRAAEGGGSLSNDVISRLKAAEATLLLQAYKTDDNMFYLIVFAVSVSPEH